MTEDWLDTEAPSNGIGPTCKHCHNLIDSHETHADDCPVANDPYLLQLWVNHDAENALFTVEKIIWQGIEIPWEIRSVDINTDPYSGYAVGIVFEDGGHMDIHPHYLTYCNVTPPKPKCPTCRQDTKELVEPKDPAEQIIDAVWTFLNANGGHNDQHVHELVRNGIRSWYTLNRE